MPTDQRPNLPYVGRVDGFELWDDVPLKAYFVSIEGRDPRKYEWEFCGLSRGGLLKGLNSVIGDEHFAVPHVAISFPHITVLYRWGDPRKKNERETNIHRVGSGVTSELSEIVIREPKPPYEIGCPAEIMILGEEMRFRSTAQVLDDYLEQSVPIGTEIPIADANILHEALMLEK